MWSQGWGKIFFWLGQTVEIHCAPGTEKGRNHWNFEIEIYGLHIFLTLNKNFLIESKYYINKIDISKGWISVR